MSVLKLKGGAAPPAPATPGVMGLPMTAMPAMAALMRPKIALHPATMKTLKIKAKRRLQAF